MKKISDFIPAGTKTVSIVGHVRPDGDCVGSVMGFYHYLRDNYPGVEADVYLSDVSGDISFMTAGETVLETADPAKRYDLAVSLDASDLSRIGAGKETFLSAAHTVCIDHHGTNPAFADENYIVAEASSCSEVLYTLLDPDGVGLATATCLYTGIIHDSGVFRYDSTSPATLRIAADLIEKGVPFSSIILHSVTERDFDELMITMSILKSSVFMREEQFLFAEAPLTLQHAFGLTSTDLGAVVSDLNTVRGAEVILFVYQMADGSWKGSLRSKERVDVSAIAVRYGGGGHIRAAGFSVADGQKNAVFEDVRQMVKEALA